VRLTEEQFGKWPQAFVWLDVETTGLDPAEDRLLEVFIEVTGPECLPLSEEFQFHAVLSTNTLTFDSVDPDVMDMHFESGLWRDCRENGLSLEKFNNGIRHFCITRLSQSLFPEPPMLAGSSVHFDRSWAAKWFPMLLEHVSHRHLDVSTFKAGLIAWGGGGEQEPAPKEDDPEEWPHHRARNDIRYDQRRAR
jgi:oligoribonuclease